MISKIFASIPRGYSGRLVEVEGDLSHGLPSFNIVGMGSKSVTESKERVRSALKSSDFSFPDSKVTINLAPAALPKEGTCLDLPIALSVLTLSRQLLPLDTKDRLFVGELSLSGSLRPVPGVINIIEAAKAAGFKEVYLPAANLAQASLISGIKLIGVSTLHQLFLHLKDQVHISDSSDVVKNTKTEANSRKSANSGPFLDHIRGQSSAKRALEIAVAGHHNILFAGPPGAGKTLLARTALSLLPPPTATEQLSITKLHSLAGLTSDVVTTRPFRTPHHTSSLPALIGSDNHPGEISLAHHGVLFLDELPEYPRNLLEALRQPLEDKEITIARARGQAVYPADFMLIATMNPCPCGYLGDPLHECTCSPPQIQSYQKKLSGPLLDRIDLYVDVDKVETADLLKPPNNTTSEHARARFAIEKARLRQRRRYQSSPLLSNASLSSHQVSTLIPLEKPAETLLKTAAEKLNLSARAYFKAIKVARTVADLAGSDVVSEEHLAEALTYRHKTS